MSKYSKLTDRLSGLGSGRWAIHQKAMARLADGDDIVMLSIGEPDTATPSGIIEAAHDAMRAGRTKYSASRGERDFVDAVAERYTERLGRPIEPGRVIFMPGSHTALYAVCHAILDPEDELLVPEPFYAAYESIFVSTGATIVTVPLLPENGFHLQMEALEAAVTDHTKAMILNNPHNPTGAVLGPDRTAEIAAFAVRNDVWILSDEVYEDLVYDGEFASPLLSSDADDHVIVLSSVSKSHSMTGWRCGWALGPEALIDRVQEVSEAMMFGAQPFLQDATAYALRNAFDECDTMYADYLRRAETVAGLFAGTALETSIPEGGIFMMLDVRSTGLTGWQFAERLLDEWDVATMPGEAFGPSGAGHIRLSLTTHDDAIALGCKRILEFAAALS